MAVKRPVVSPFVCCRKRAMDQQQMSPGCRWVIYVLLYVMRALKHWPPFGALNALRFLYKILLVLLFRKVYSNTLPDKSTTAMIKAFNVFAQPPQRYVLVYLFLGLNVDICFGQVNNSILRHINYMIYTVINELCDFNDICFSSRVDFLYLNVTKTNCMEFNLQTRHSA